MALERRVCVMSDLHLGGAYGDLPTHTTADRICTHVDAGNIVRRSSHSINCRPGADGASD